MSERLEQARHQVREHRLERASREWLVNRIEALEVGEKERWQYAGWLDALYDELTSLNDDWFHVADAERRTRVQNALGIAAGFKLYEDEKAAAGGSV